MRARALRRALLAFCLEAQLIGAALGLFGFLPVSFPAMVGFALLAFLLFWLGGWLYYGGGGSFLLHTLLYPTVAAIGIAAYVAFDSWAVGLALAGVYYWRVHTNVTLRLYYHDLFLRFVLGIVLLVAHLLFNTLVFSLYSRELPDNGPLFGMLALLLASFIAACWGEYLTREKPGAAMLARTELVRLGSQLLQAKAALAAGYTTAAAAALLVLTLLWALLKKPLVALLGILLVPVAAMLEYLLNRLAALANNSDLLARLGEMGQNEQQVPPPTDLSGNDWAGMAGPYIVGGIIVLCVWWLARKMWQRRYRRVEAAAEGQERAHTAITKLAPDSGQSGLAGRLRQAVQMWFGPKDDRVRYLYYQFLRFMASQGWAMRKDETSHEFLQRLSAVWRDPAALSLAEKITLYYERHRYDRNSLNEQETAELENSLQMLRKNPPRRQA